MRGPPLRIPAPLHGRCALVGGPGRARGLYLRCGIDGRPCTALVDTGSTISLVRPGVFPGTTGALSGGVDGDQRPPDDRYGTGDRNEGKEVAGRPGR